MRGQCTRILCLGDHNEEFPKCGWCKEVTRCKELQRKRMNEKIYRSLSVIDVCRIISKNRKDGICSMNEPDDRIDAYIDFLEIFPDWGNDDELLRLIDGLFSRKSKKKKIGNREKRGWLALIFSLILALLNLAGFWIAGLLCIIPYSIAFWDFLNVYHWGTEE